MQWKQIYAKICHSISIVKFCFVFFGVECGHHKITSGVDLVLVLVHALVPSMFTLVHVATKFWLWNFIKIKFWKKLKLGSLRWHLKFRHNISMVKKFKYIFWTIIWSSIERKWVRSSPSSCGDIIPPMSTWVMSHLSTYVHVTAPFKLWKII